MAMQAVVDTLAEIDPKAAKSDAKKFISDRYLKKLDEEGFLQKLTGPKKAAGRCRSAFGGKPKVDNVRLDDGYCE